jgi:hypothetical protein
LFLGVLRLAFLMPDGAQPQSLSSLPPPTTTPRFGQLWSPEGEPTTGGNLPEVIRRNQERLKEGERGGGGGGGGVLHRGTLPVRGAPRRPSAC